MLGGRPISDNSEALFVSSLPLPLLLWFTWNTMVYRPLWHNVRRSSNILPAIFRFRLPPSSLHLRRSNVRRQIYLVRIARTSTYNMCVSCVPSYLAYLSYSIVSFVSNFRLINFYPHLYVHVHGIHYTLYTCIQNTYIHDKVGNCTLARSGCKQKIQTNSFLHPSQVEALHTYIMLCRIHTGLHTATDIQPFGSNGKKKEKKNSRDPAHTQPIYTQANRHTTVNQ